MENATGHQNIMEYRGNQGLLSNYEGGNRDFFLNSILVTFASGPVSGAGYRESMKSSCKGGRAKLERNLET